MYLVKKIIRLPVVIFLTIVTIMTISTDYSMAENQPLTSYKINNVHVTVKSFSSANARDKAFLIGKKQAFDTLMQELVKEEDIPKLPTLSDEILSSYVVSFGVQSSKVTKYSFMGVLSYEFNLKKINNFLLSAKVKFMRMTNKPILIVPISKFGDQYFMGYGSDTTTFWQQSWINTKTLNYGLLSFKYLENSSVLSSSVTPQAILAGERHAILALRRHFGLLDIAIVYISPDSNKLSGKILYIPIHNKPITLPLDSTSENYEMSINNAKKLIADYWKDSSMNTKSSDSIIQIVSTIRQIKPWLRLKRYVQSVGTNTSVISLQIGHMSLITNYPGGGKYLANLLRGYGYHMIKKGTYWEVSLTGHKSYDKKGVNYKGKISSAPVKHMNVESSNLPVAK